jgi:hypothetical protein
MLCSAFDSARNRACCEFVYLDFLASYTASAQLDRTKDLKI